MKFMKLVNRLLLWVLAVGFSAPKLLAQFDKLNYRAEAGLTMSKVSNYGIGNPLVGFRLSGQVLLPFERSAFGLVSGLTLTTKGEAGQQFYNHSNPHTRANEKYNTRMLFLQLPLEVSFRLNLNESNNIYLATGPYFAYGLSAKGNSLVESVANLDFFEKDGGSTPFKRTELGWGINAMYAYKGIYAKAGAELSLNDVMNDTPSVSERRAGTSRHATFYVTLGYQF